MAARSEKRLAHGDEDAILAGLVFALGAEPSVDDRAAWLSMSPAQRDKALQRISVLEEWNSERRDMGLEVAAHITGVSAKRFYEMASAWRKRRGLASLGVFAKSQDRRSRLDERAVNLLQSLLPRVVDANPEGSVESLRSAVVRELEAAVAAAPPPGPRLRIPSRMVVRRMVERELARRAAEHLVAYDVAFDRCPLSLVDEGGVRFVVFAVVDRASGLLFGVASGQVSDGMAGYAAAARDALGRIPELTGVGEWADSTQRIEVSTGADGAAANLAAAIAAVPGGPAVNSASVAPGGRYLRAAAGDRLGRAELRATVSLVKGQPVGESLVYAPAAARLEVSRGADVHNAAIVDRAGRSPEPPQNLMAVLNAVAALGPRPGR